ncbi:MAG TPA: nitronate monooxygenase, partial [Acidimicrobiales bacterium]
MSDTPSDSPLDTRFCDLVGCRLPVVQTGMGWVSGASLTAATSDAGGFGILAAVTMTLDELAAAIGRVKDRTGAPFGVNVRPDQSDLAERIDLCVARGVRLVSFAGAPAKDTVARLHDAGVLVMPTVGARRHAEKMLDFGVDAVIAQGAEGGGHTGTVPTSLLLPQVVDAVGHALPVLGAGGFHDGRGLVAALAWGADGIAMGTRFLLTAESRVPDEVKARYLAAAVNDTVVTTALDGAPQRVIRTPAVDKLERSSALTRLPRALRAALRFRRLTGTPIPDLVREGVAMKRHQDLSWAQVVM